MGMADELRALTRLAFEELGLGAGGVGQVHRAIADRAFPGPSLAKLLHDGISGAVYAGVQGGAVLAGARRRRVATARARGLAARCSPCSTGCGATCSSARAASWRSR